MTDDLTPEACRARREALGWSRGTLARKAQIRRAHEDRDARVIRQFEMGLWPLAPAVLERIDAALRRGEGG